MRFVIALIAIAAAVPAAAQTVELPQRRAGQWEIRMTIAGREGPLEVQQCLDAETDRDMMQAGLNASRDMCSRFEMRREGQGFVMESVCQFGQMRTSSRAVFSGDFQSAYSMRLTGTSEGGPAGRTETNVTQNARWVSSECRSGLMPGDMLMPGGMRVNVREMLRAAPPQQQQTQQPAPASPPQPRR